MAGRRSVFASFQRAVLGALMPVSVAIMERGLRKALKKR